MGQQRRGWGISGQRFGRHLRNNPIEFPKLQLSVTQAHVFVASDSGAGNRITDAGARDSVACEQRRGTTSLKKRGDDHSDEVVKWGFGRASIQNRPNGFPGGLVGSKRPLSSASETPPWRPTKFEFPGLPASFAIQPSANLAQLCAFIVTGT